MQRAQPGAQNHTTVVSPETLSKLKSSPAAAESASKTTEEEGAADVSGADAVSS